MLDEMLDDNLCLRQNIQVEPLLDHWYAWPHLIPHATVAHNITERHLKIMDSYISKTEARASAVKTLRTRKWAKLIQAN